MARTSLALGAAVFLIVGCGESAEQTPGDGDRGDCQPDADCGERGASEAFFANVAALCGQEFDGEGVYPEDPDHPMIGVPLRVAVESCEEAEIRLGFYVDDNEHPHATWILTLSDEYGLHLYHDHRDEDGQPDEITGYGGYADDRGSSLRQYFPADEHTATMIPEAETNVWMLGFDPHLGRLTYYLERHDAPRYRAELFDGDVPEETPKEAFFDTVGELCGEEFRGEGIYPEDPEHPMIGVPLRVAVETCEEAEVRLGFYVDGNEHPHATWILTLSEGGALHLYHDHRDEDGQPDEITGYGGYADERGSSFRQYFPADEHTAALLPEAETNVWMLDVDLQFGKLSYYLDRHDEPRYRAELFQ